MRMEDIPIATPTKIPNISPRSNPESDPLSEIINGSLFEINEVWLLDLGIISNTVESTIVEFKSESFSEFINKSDEIFVNFAVSVIGSVVEFPPNKVE
jgi:hypothetical protein